MKNIYIILFCLATSYPSQIHSSKVKKKSTKTTTTTESPTDSLESTTVPPAIIAIEIVDPNENSTSAKNSKRNIDGALGYGYNNYNKLRYEVYKYSQHDIPAFKGSSSSAFKNTDAPINIQKSIEYTLPTITEYVQSTANSILQPGTTLYSTLGSKGQVGGLTSSLDKIEGLDRQQTPVPVVVLRIYPDQLKHSTIQANLPASHPFSKTINSLNLQELLLRYIKALQSQASQYQETQYEPSQSIYSPDQEYSSPTKAHNTTYQDPNYYAQNNYQKPVDNGAVNEQQQVYQYYQQHYPEENRHQQDQYQQQQYTDYRDRVNGQKAPVSVKYKFRYQSPAIQTNHEKNPENVQPQPQFYYVTSNTPSYSTESAQYHKPSEHVKYIQQQPQIQQYYIPSDQQYQEYYQAAEPQYIPKSQKLLTSENYPSDKHTRVIFRTKTGDVRTPEQDESRSKEIKTIKIHVPDNVAKVEVEESENPYHNYQNPDPYPTDQISNIPTKYYVPQESTQQEYYSTEARPESERYSYQNIDYDQMSKYYSRRGVMPNYFYQNYEDVGRESQRPMSDDIVAAYEEASFPSTTKSPDKKRVKSKKRT